MPPDKDRTGDEKAGGKPPDDGKGKDEKPKEGAEAKPGSITDAHLERAVKAGLSIADAKTFQSPEALERMCGLLEARKADDKAGADGKDGKGKEGEQKPPDDPLAAIPDLDPNEYDEKVVAGFKAMKDIIRGQQAVINSLHTDGKARDSSWIDGQMAGLGEAYVAAIGKGSRAELDPNSQQAQKRAELESKFNILTAGYKANGNTVDRETVFKEAVAVVLGDVAVKAATDLKAKKLEERGRQHITRPSGGMVSPATDKLGDVAGELDRKYFGKK